MIARAIEELRSQRDLSVVHLPFFFTPHWSRSRQIGFRKIFELLTVIGRLARIRLSGRIDLLLYPNGGPSLIPILRDLALLPFCLLLSRRTVLYIHAGGTAEAVSKLPRWFGYVIRSIYGRCEQAIVLTQFSKHDAFSLGIEDVVVVSNTLPDSFEPKMVDRSANVPLQLLSVGHLSATKGTGRLLTAIAQLSRFGHDLQLHLVGEPLAPYSWENLSDAISAMGLENVVKVSGTLLDEAKWASFARADLFVFPSTAYESQPLVLLEAMMWGLPIVATDWRANSEILGEPPGGICYSVADDPTEDLISALKEAANERNRFTEWGRRNRERFLAEFAEDNWRLVPVIREACELNE